MVLYPIPPGGGRRRAGSRPDWRISAVFDPIATGPGQGTRAALCCGCARRSALIYGINPIPGNGGAPWAAFAGAGSAGSGQRAAVPGRSIAGRAAGRMFCLRAGQAGSGHKKAPGDFPRGVVRGQRARSSYAYIRRARSQATCRTTAP